MMNEILHGAAFDDRQRAIEHALRHSEPGTPRRGLLARWRAHRAANTAAATAAPTLAAVPELVAERDHEPAASDAA